MKSKLDDFYILLNTYVNHMPSQYENDIYHYTSPNGVNSILYSDSGNIKLWASRFDCLNDASEGKIVMDIFNETCKKMLKNKIISKELFDVVSTVRPSKTRLIKKWVNGELKISRPEYESYIISFSKNRDSLAMWNYYSKENKYEGYNIGFSPKNLTEYLENSFSEKDVEVSLYPIVYNRDEQEMYIFKLLSKMQELYDKQYENQIRAVVSEHLLEWNLIFKSEFFKHEEEVRIIIDIAKRTKNGVLQPRPLKVNYRNNRGFEIPYIIVDIDKKLLKNICIGPLQCEEKYKTLQIEIINDKMNINGYSNVEISYSEIPIRY